MDTILISQHDAYRMMLREYPDILNINQASEVLDISTKTCYKLLQEGKIIGLKVGRAYRIPKIHILSYLKVCKQ